MDVPEIESDEPVTLEQCMSAKKGFFNSPDGKRVQISPGETILYQYILLLMKFLEIQVLRVFYFYLEFEFKPKKYKIQ